MHNGNLTFFDIGECGLANFVGDNIASCEARETFNLIKEWVEGRGFSDTIPWDPNVSYQNLPKAYCKGIYYNKATEDYFMVLWKADANGTEGLWGVPENNTSEGDGFVRHDGKHKGKKVIWGRPCYYWIIPEYNIVVSIKFRNSLSDAQLFQHYIRSAINNRVDHPNRKKEYTEKDYVRLIHTDDEGDHRCFYRFSMSLKYIETSKSELQKIAGKVRYIVRRETVKIKETDQKAQWLKFFGDKIPFTSAGKDSSGKAKKERRIEIKAEANPTVDEIRSIIQETLSESDANGWDNVGFETADNTVWVDSFRLKEQITIPNAEDKILTGEELSHSISLKRSQLLREIEKSLNTNEKDQVQA